MRPASAFTGQGDPGRGHRWSKLPAKVAEDLAAGVHVVCVVEPKEEFVLVGTPDAAPRQLSGDDLLKLPDVLPGFWVRVREFF